MVIVTANYCNTAQHVTSSTAADNLTETDTIDNVDNDDNDDRGAVIVIIEITVHCSVSHHNTRCLIVTIESQLI